MRTPRWAVLGAALAALLVPTINQASAQAASPWWHLESASRPTYIQPGSAQNEVQEILITSAECAFFCTDPTSQVANFQLKIGGNGVGPEFATEPGAVEFSLPIPTETSIAGVLEGANVYGPGNVEVEEVSDDKEGNPLGPDELRFLVTTIGEKADSPVTPLEAESFIGTATTSTVTPGRPDAEIVLSAVDIGNADVEGALAPVKLTDVLPAGLEPIGIAASKPLIGTISERVQLPCELATLTCTLEASLVPPDALEMKIAVKVVGPLAGPNTFSISGGGAPAASTSSPLTISTAPTPFAVHTYAMALEEEGGTPAARAASHPFQFTTQIALNQGRDINPLVLTGMKPEVLPVGLPKDVHFNLPPGLIGNPSKLPRCTLAQFFTPLPIGPSSAGQGENSCPAASAVGAINTTVAEPVNENTLQVAEPLFNLEPGFGEPARFGFDVSIANSPVFIDTSLRSGVGQDYGITAETNNITQTAAFLSATATFWGVPGAPGHENQRGWGCFGRARGLTTVPPCLPSEEPHPPVVFSLPTSCAAPLATSVDIDSWEDRTPVNSAGAFSPGGDLKGCNQVPFAPQIHSEPTSNAATSPTGLRFDIDIDDPGLENAGGLTQSEIKRAVVTLPQGFTTNPSVAEGLKACSQAEYEAATAAEGSGCLEESKVGEVEIQSPLIPTNAEGITPKVKGGLFVARQGLNPNHNLLTIYMIARSPELGILVRQALKVTPDPVTGQLTTEVDDIPQLPFSKFHLEFRTGQRAPLVTPATCGTYTVKALLYPYSEPAVPLEDESSFQINAGPEGGGCPSGTPPFHPTLEAGTTNNAAGSYSPFYTRISRKDSEQEITHFSIKLPPGLSGKLVGVAQCSDAQIAAAKAREHEGGGEEELQHPSCPSSSEVGHTTVGTGVGNVLAYAPGKLYLAGPYKGSNLSIVSITAAKVGPFDLGTVVIREGLKVNPETAQVSVDAAGSDPIPHIVDGIPVHLRDIRIYVDRPSFTLNPTSCAKMSTAATVLGSGTNFASEADDQPVTVTSPFQAADCASLGFKPELALKLLGKTKRAGLPKLVATVTYPKGGAYANIAKTVVNLPDSEFLEQGHIGTVCTRVQFNEGGGNGERCPAKSVYGHAKALTPLLEEPVEGPVYLRSNGGERQLPDLVAALHSKDIDIDLVGFIDSVHKKGTENSSIRTRFLSVPDAPVSKFTLEMAGGKKGLLINSTNLCKGTHRAKSVFTGQNGKLLEAEPAVQAQCGKKGKKSKGGKSGGKKKGGK